MLLGIVITVSVILVATMLLSLFATSEDRRKNVECEILKEKIQDFLPGNNCGACGCKTCGELAGKIADGKATASACRSGGEQVAQAVGVLLGCEDTDHEVLRAQVMCSCTNSNASVKYLYDRDCGEADCHALMSLGGGERECRFACIGMGSCQKSCPYGAIGIVDGTAQVDYRKCTGCGICTQACPKGLIKLIPYDTYYWVGCSSADNRLKTAKKCAVGCTGCGECEKVCPEGAISVGGNVASIDYTLCTGCGNCYRACPEGVIWKADAVGVSDLVFTRGRKKRE